MRKEEGEARGGSEKERMAGLLLGVGMFFLREAVGLGIARDRDAARDVLVEHPDANSAGTGAGKRSKTVSPRRSKPSHVSRSS